MGTIKLVLGIGLIVAMVWAGAEVIPPYFANYEFEDAIKNEATISTYSNKGEDAIREAVFKKAQELELPLSKDQIKVQRTGMQGNGSVIIEAPYTVHVDLPGYPMDLEFDPATKNKGMY
jgi:hypothetical protein